MKKLFIAAGLAIILGMSQSTDHDYTIKYQLKKIRGAYKLDMLETVVNADYEQFNELYDNGKFCIVLKAEVYILDSLETGEVRVRIDKTKTIFWTYSKNLKKSKKQKK